MAKTSKLSGYEQFMALSDADKEEVFRSLDRPARPDELRPLDAADRRLHRRARKRGRPARGEGAETVSVTIERGLLRRADAWAQRCGLTRARLIAIALENTLPKADARAGAGTGGATLTESRDDRANRRATATSRAAGRAAKVA